MLEKKKIGRPPANWMFKLIDLNLSEQWTDAYEIADKLKLNVKTVKSFFYKLNIQPKHVVIKGKARAQFNVNDLRQAIKLRIKPWL